VPEIWHTANSAFAVPVVAVGASPCATLGEIFTVCPGGFAVCLGHTAKYRNPVVWSRRMCAGTPVSGDRAASGVLGGGWQGCCGGCMVVRVDGADDELTGDSAKANCRAAAPA